MRLRLVAVGIAVCLPSTSALGALVTAEHAPAATGFSVGAGMAIDPPAPLPFDNRLAQTFTATQTGLPATA